MTGNLLLLLLLAILLSGIIVYFQYAFKKELSRYAIAAALLRWFALFCLFWLLFNPKFQQKVYSSVKPKLLLLVDNSNSIHYLKQQQAVSNITSKIKENTEIIDKFDLNWYAFGNQLLKTEDFNFDLAQTNIDQALQQATKLYQTKSPIILITDGLQTVGQTYKYRRLNQPIFPVIVGDTSKPYDVTISRVNTNKYSFLNNEFPVEVLINFDGKSKQKFTFNLFQNNELHYTKNLELGGEMSSKWLTFYLKADQVGYLNFKAEISSFPTENNIKNNIEYFNIEVIDEQSKIAIVHDIVHPDLGVLKRSIEANQQRKVEFVNPTGLKGNIDQYDAVILYQPNESFKQIFEVLNKDNHHMFVITGAQTDWQFLNNAQPYFSKEVSQQTESYLPQLNKGFNIFEVPDLDLDNYPPLTDLFGDLKVNVQHQVLFEKVTQGLMAQSPMLITYTDQQRRGVSFFGENLWAWRLAEFRSNQSFLMFDDFINSLLQYVTIKQSRNRLDVDFRNFYDKGDPINFNVKLYDANLNFDKDAVIELNVIENNRIYPFVLKANRYQLTLPELPPNTYSFIIKNKGKNIFSGSFVVRPFTAEQKQNRSNIEDLKHLAIQNNSKVYTANQIDELLQLLIHDDSFKTIQKVNIQENSIIHWRWLLVLIVLSLGGEWLIRKYYGMI